MNWYRPQPLSSRPAGLSGSARPDRRALLVFDPPDLTDPTRGWGGGTLEIKQDPKP